MKAAFMLKALMKSNEVNEQMKSTEAARTQHFWLSMDLRWLTSSKQGD